jgi:hypothetical protein
MRSGFYHWDHALFFIVMLIGLILHSLWRVRNGQKQYKIHMAVYFILILAALAGHLMR